MRLAFVNHSRIRLPLGGQVLNSNSIGLWSYWVATRLADRCEEVTVYHQIQEDEVLDETCAGVSFRGLPVRGDERRQRLWAKWDKLRGKVGLEGDPLKPRFARSSYRGYTDAVARDLAQRGCDVVHISNYPHFAPPIKARNPGVRINLHMQCDWLVQLDRAMLAKYLDACDLISGCSNHVIDGVAKRFPEHAHKCFTLYNGVDTEDFKPSGEAAGDGEPLILFVGRLSPEKGLHTLMRALETVVAAHPKVRVRIVGGRGQAPYEFIVALDPDPLVQAMKVFYGDGPYTYERALHAMVPEGLGDQLQFINHLPQAELRKLYQQATLFVFPSEWHEPFGMPVIEAMACEMPVVITESGGMPEFVKDGESGFVVPRGDAAGLGEAIHKLLADPDLRQRMGAAGRVAVERGFTWSHVADTLYERLTAGS